MSKEKETIDWTDECERRRSKFVVFCCCLLFICGSNGWSHYLTKPTSLMWEKSTFHYSQHFELNEKEIGWSHFVCKRLATLKGMFLIWFFSTQWRRPFQSLLENVADKEWSVSNKRLLAQIRVIIFTLKCDCCNNAPNVFNWWLMTLYDWEEKHLSWCTAHVLQCWKKISQINRSERVWDEKREKR